MMPAWLTGKPKGKSMAEIRAMNPEDKSAYFRELGRRGGRARMAMMTIPEKIAFQRKAARAACKVVNANMTSEQRRERSRKAGTANIGRMTPGEIKDQMVRLGKASAAAKTPEQRSEHARRAVQARWAK